jgi:hypothetical protein
MNVTCSDGPNPEPVTLTVEPIEGWDRWRPTSVAVNGVSEPGILVPVDERGRLVVDVGCRVDADVARGRVVLWAFSNDYTRTRTRTTPYEATEHPPTETRAEGFTSTIDTRRSEFVSPPHPAMYFVSALCEATVPTFEPGPEAHADAGDRLIAVVPTLYP